nr:MAG TPA: Receptor Binding Protein [Caudoviricetes sp.]
MAMQSFPFTSEVTFDDSGFPQFDRAVGSDVLRNVLSNYYTNGVFGISNTNCFKVVASTDGGMGLSIQSGSCLINGATAYCKEETRITLANSEALSRFDAIVLRLDDNKAHRDIRIEVVKGTAQSQPVKPMPTREGAVYDLVLAYIFVKANVSTITNADITDTRIDKNLCGFVNAINNLNVDSLHTQHNAMFNAWFEGIKNRLGSDLAGNLQNQINAIKSEQSQLLQRVYPIGSLYISESTVSPATLFGFGRWEKIEDRFLIGASGNTPIKSQGGSAIHTHGQRDGRNGNLAAAIGAVNNQPNTIGYKAANDTNIGAVGGATYVVAGTNLGFGSWNHFTQVVGQTAEAITYPPYYAVNIWKRTA